MKVSVRRVAVLAVAVALVAAGIAANHTGIVGAAWALVFGSRVPSIADTERDAEQAGKDAAQEVADELDQETDADVAADSPLADEHVADSVERHAVDDAAERRADEDLDRRVRAGVQPVDPRGATDLSRDASGTDGCDGSNDTGGAADRAGGSLDGLADSIGNDLRARLRRRAIESQGDA